MLRVSDNFLAEQLLLMCSTRVGYRDSLSSRRAIRYLLKTTSKPCPTAPDWVDGSGLSRLNLLTPRTSRRVLLRLHQELPEAAPAEPAGGRRRPGHPAQALLRCRPAHTPGSGAKPAP